MNIILASASPRRREILEQIGINFTVQASSVKEDIAVPESAECFVEKLAFMKAQEVARRIVPGSLVIGADTIVLSKGSILGKPGNEDEAFIMLRSLSDNTHLVLTGLALIESPGERILVSHKKTEVKFRAISDDEIWAYINTGEPLDKAGSYGIQGRGAIFVEKINGCYFNVVGLPVSKLYLMLREFGIEPLIRRR